MVVLGYGAEGSSIDRGCCRIELKDDPGAVGDSLTKKYVDTAIKDWEDGDSTIQLAVSVKNENAMRRGIFIVDIDLRISH